MVPITNNPARPTSRKSRELKQPTPLTNFSKPNVGEPWPDLNPEDVHWPDIKSGGFHFWSFKNRTTTATSFHVGPWFVLSLVLALIVGYAIANHDRGLLTDVLRFVGRGTHARSATESPPET